MIKRLFPGLRYLDHYTKSTFRSDLLSGLTVAILLIPQGMGYAMVAGLPPEFGLYACVVPPIIYALFGTSNKISIGPVALDSVLILTGLSALAAADTERYLSLAITLTFMVGIIQALLGMAKLGFIANFLSHPVITGYTSGAALVIIINQINYLVGTSASQGNVLTTLYELVIAIPHWHLLTCILGALGIAVLILGKRFYKGPPYPLLVLIGGMLAAGLFQLGTLGVAVVSDIPVGLPSVALPSLVVDDIQSLIPLALTVALMGYAGSMSITKSLQDPSDKVTPSPNQELIALGFANVIGAFFKAFPVSASFSRSAAFRDAGAKTQISAIVSAAVILFILLFLVPLFMRFPIPKTLLSAIVIVSVMGLFKYSVMKQLAKQNKTEFLICLTTLLLTVAVGIQLGLIIGVLLSIIFMIFHTAKPHIAELGQLEDGGIYRNIHRFEDAKIRPEILIFRFDAPLCFANKDYFTQHLYQLMEQRPSNTVKHIVLDAESVNTIDASGLLMLKQLSAHLTSQSIKFYITNAIGPVRDAIKDSVFTEFISEDTMFATLHDAVEYIDSGHANHVREALQTNCT